MTSWLMKHRDGLTGLVFVLPAAAYMIIMMFYPLVYNFVLSFKDLTVMTFKGNNAQFIGFANYVTIVKDPEFQQAFWQTLWFTVACIAVQFSLGLLLAVFFNEKFALAGPIRGMVLVAWMMPVSVTGLLFKYMFLTEGGAINKLLSMVGIGTAQPLGWLIDPKLAMWAVIIANCWVGVPFNMLLLTTGMSNISQDVYESSAIDGANTVQRFFYITVPLLKPAIMSVLMLGFIYTFKVFDLIFMMTKGGPLNATEVLSTYSYRHSFTLFNFSIGAASAVLLFLCLMCVGVFYLRLIQKDEVM
ncbi:MAG: sugar ABC transporter permease [Clostridia bacterium]|nr:sugar ABC transporter permease [Clostridia bacterium]